MEETKAVLEEMLHDLEWWGYLEVAEKEPYGRAVVRALKDAIKFIDDNDDEWGD